MMLMVRVDYHARCFFYFAIKLLLKFHNFCLHSCLRNDGVDLGFLVFAQCVRNGVVEAAYVPNIVINKLFVRPFFVTVWTCSKSYRRTLSI